jgi:hypothetical protein
MAKRARWPSHIGPAIFNKRPKPDLPSWDLGLVPGPDKPREEVQEFKRKAEAYFAECDRIKNEYLLREWRRFLGVANSDDALMKLGELSVSVLMGSILAIRVLGCRFMVLVLGEGALLPLRRLYLSKSYGS